MTSDAGLPSGSEPVSGKTSPDTALRVEDIHKRFGGVYALAGVSLSMAPGRVHCLAGENGSGKSTLIKIISGAVAADSGWLVIQGRRHRTLSPRGAMREGINVIYQDLALLPNLTVAENIVLTREIVGGRLTFKYQAARRESRSVMAQLGVDIAPDALVGDLPVGQRQLVAISRALAQDARFLFMDEPTAALAAREVTVLLRVISRLRDHGVAVAFVSHKLHEIFNIADEITVLRDGRVVAGGDVRDFDPSSLTKAMTGHAVGRLTGIQKQERDTVALELRDLSVAGAFRHVDLRVRAGEIVGLTGLLGSGRDAVAEAIFGLRPIHGGDIVVGGRPTRYRSARQAMRQNIGYVPGDRLTEGLSLRHSVALNAVAASVDSIPRRLGAVTRSAVRRLGEDAVRHNGVKTESARTPVSHLSGGNQQKVVLAKWLRRKPRILVLNGPTVGVDVGARREILRLVRDLSSAGAAVLLASDDIAELVEVCDRVIVMRAGAVAAELADGDVSEANVAKELQA